MEQSVSVFKNRRAITRLVLVALFAALTAAGTFITIPLYPVPVVLQNLFTLLAGLVLGPVLGGAAVGLYLLAGALGAPVFAGAVGGITRFFGPTGGFLYGYLLSAVVAGLIAGSPKAGVKTPLWRIILGALVGILAVYLPGLPQLRRIMDPAVLGGLAQKFLAAGDNLSFIPLSVRAAFQNMDPSWLGTLVAGFLPFLIGDILKAVVAILIASRLRRAVAEVLAK